VTHAIRAGAAVDRVVAAVREVVGWASRPVLLHEPTLGGRAWSNVKECIDTAWVSSAGQYVTAFEGELARFTGATHAVSVVNGTSALHVALLLAGVEPGDEVLVPALTFVATANAVSYCGAVPHFVDVEERSLGLDPVRLRSHLDAIGDMRRGGCYNRRTGRRLAAMVPVHTFGHPADLAPLVELADSYGIPLIEDAAEALGSWYDGRHTGRFGRMGTLSFNGNKIITTGGGGAILTDDAGLAERARHLTTTAKRPHPWEYDHDQVAFNYRMPNLNAALGCAQMEQLPGLLEAKRALAESYQSVFADVGGMRMFREQPYARSNYWLNVLVLDPGNSGARDPILQALADEQIQARPVWKPMHELAMYGHCPRADLGVTEDLAQRIINLPSSAHLRPDTRAGAGGTAEGSGARDT
jgi:perosamine synthetase